MGLFDSGGTITTTQQGAPWTGQSPYLEWLYGQAQNLPQQQFFPGSTVVPQSPETLQALNMQTQRATDGSPVQTAGQNQLTGTLQGDYLYGGQGFNAAFDAAQRRITPTVQGQFEGAGRFGGGLAQEAETSALSDAFAGLYNQERNRQISGLAAVPSMAALDYQDIAALSNVGQQREAFEGQKLADQMNRFNFAQQAPYQQLEAQSNVIQAGYPGGSTTSQTPYFNDLLGQIAGGALTGLSLADALKGGIPGLGGAAGTGAAGAGAAGTGAAGTGAGAAGTGATGAANTAVNAAEGLLGLAPNTVGTAAANAGIVPASLSGGGLGTSASSLIPTGGITSGIAGSNIAATQLANQIPSQFLANTGGTMGLPVPTGGAATGGTGATSGATGLSALPGFFAGTTPFSALGAAGPLGLAAAPYAFQSLFGSTGPGTIPPGNVNLGGGNVILADEQYGGKTFQSGQLIDNSGNVVGQLTDQELQRLRTLNDSTSETSQSQLSGFKAYLADKYGLGSNSAEMGR